MTRSAILAALVLSSAACGDAKMPWTYFTGSKVADPNMPAGCVFDEDRDQCLVAKWELLSVAYGTTKNVEGITPPPGSALTACRARMKNITDADIIDHFQLKAVAQDKDGNIYHNLQTKWYAYAEAGKVSGHDAEAIFALPAAGFTHFIAVTVQFMPEKAATVVGKCGLFY